MQPPSPTDSDTWLRASWRARPGSFVALMSLYESNRIRLRSLLGEVRAIEGTWRSAVEGECPLEVVVLEQSAYTTILLLNYLFDEATGVVREPSLEVRLYHDADLAEASRVGVQEPRGPLRAIDRLLPASLDARWRRNILLNKWLEYLTDTGHGPETFHAVR
jgi:uncharacterized protein YqiB (DUF1249 family)